MIDTFKSFVYRVYVEARFADDDLARLETQEPHSGRCDQAIVRAFRIRMQTIRAAPDERTFYALRSLRFEELHDRPGVYSMRLNDQWRLTMKFEGKGPGKIVVVIAIEDYH